MSQRRCNICETRPAEEGQRCCILCESSDGYLESGPKGETNGYIPPLPPAPRFRDVAAMPAAVAEVDVTEEPRDEVDMGSTDRLCSDCKKRQIVARGLCINCYARHKRLGALPPSVRPQKHPKRKAVAESAATAAPSQTPGELCEDCHERPLHARGKCARCWSRARRNGEFGDTVKHPGTHTTPVPGKPHAAKERPAPVADQDLDALLVSVKAERDEAVAKAEREYESMVAAIKRVRALLRK